MAEHMQEWLNAYLDGELSEGRRERVEQHLAICPTCRAELDELRRLSQAVQQVPLPQELPSAERFTAQMMLRLPRQQTKPARRSGRELGWWLVPAILLGGWAFVHAVFWLSNGIWAAGQVGLLGKAATWLAPETQSTGAVSGLFNWLGMMPTGNALHIATFSESIGWSMLLQFLLEGGLALLYLGWLVTWWQRRQQQSAGFAPATFQKNGL